MTSPIERAETELARLDLCLPTRDRLAAALAVFESIDPDDIAQAIIRRYPSFDPLSSDGIAAAVKAWLTGKDQT